MMVFRPREGRNGADICEVNGAEYTGSDALRTAARALVSAGAPDQPWEMRRGDVVCLFGRSLFALAFTNVSETDKRFVRGLFVKHPHAAPDPVLDPLLAEFSQRWRESRKASA